MKIITVIVTHNRSQLLSRCIDSLKNLSVDGIIIDLRNNGGGSLQEAIDLTGLFIETGPVVQIKSSSGRIEIEKDFDKRIHYDGPLLVLNNSFTASSSEIFCPRAAPSCGAQSFFEAERSHGAARNARARQRGRKTFRRQRMKCVAHRARADEHHFHHHRLRRPSPKPPTVV